ncbi:MAG: hypothetical protein U9R48_00850 [Chloroflexota bacterium]|nr:hypothetical protein [Chloroflexota bacterium]
MLRIKTYPELNVAAVRGRKETPLRIWYLCRHLDVAGEGRVHLSTLRSFVREHDLFSRQTLWRGLQEAHETFWRRDGEILYYRSLHKVAEEMGVDLHRHPVNIPLRSFASMGALRAAFVSSLFADKERMIAQETLATLSARHRRTVQRYLKRAKVTRCPNVMISRRENTRQLSREMAEEGYFRGCIEDRWFLCRRLPNTYYWPQATTCAYGLVKHYWMPRVTTSSSTHKASNWHPTSSTTRGAPRRRYFTKPKAVARATERMWEGERIYEQRKGTGGQGWRLWRGYMRVGEEVMMM